MGRSGVVPGKTIFMDVPRCARESGYSVRQIRRYIEDLEIPAHRIGRGDFILRRDFEAFMAVGHQWKSKLPAHRRNRGAA
jgi:hypothetical protein